MKEVGTFEAKNKFSEMIQKVRKKGAKFLITNRGEPMAMLVPAVQDRVKANTAIDALIAFGKANPLKLKKGEELKSLIEEGRK
ncbi:MAG: type II toxin-antitoxin system prevent-host-death family antitoxin [Symploca sp. SIO2G7]|nr:type II toxin-antitoxin system prevent-host-death family antitoxin [Symploca sp. SIO2G7]